MAAPLQGDVDTTGQQLFACASQTGFGVNTAIHAVGDGAPWIANQIEEQFGATCSIFTLCDYLSAAAKVIVAGTIGQKNWMDEQKTRLKTQRADDRLQILSLHLEGTNVDDSDAPVRQCHRYLSHRREQSSTTKTR